MTAQFLMKKPRYACQVFRVLGMEKYLSASVKSTYAFTDNCKPYGKVKLCSKGTVVFVATRQRPNAPTVLFLR